MIVIPKKKWVILQSFVLSVISFLLIGCEKKIELNEKGSDEISFNVDTDLLGPKIINPIYSLEYYPPRFLVALPEDSLKLFEHEFQEFDRDSLKISLLHIWADSSYNNSFIISSISFSGIPNFDLLAKYTKILSTRTLFSKASKAIYSKNNLLMTQFILNNDNFVLIKIIIEGKNNNLLQFDYVLSLNYYEKEVRSIESSIGSINKL